MAARAGLGFRCYYDDEPAILAADHCVRVNYEAFVFCSPEHRSRFEESLVAHCGTVTDVVSKARFRPAADTPRLSRAGVTYLFATNASKEAFVMTPDRYVRPGWRM